MTGFLHRLAARAAGTAQTVRSDARLPFGAGPWHDGEAAPDAAAPAPVLQAPPRATPRPPALRAAWQPLGAMPPDEADATPAPAARPAPLLPTPAPSTTRPAPQALQQAQMSHATGGPAAPHARQPAAGTAREAALHTTQAAGSPDAPRAPAPLLPPLRADTPPPHIGAAPRPPASRAGGMAQPALGADTEVHIHIGRIDVTAVHDSPKPQARPRERTPPVSLDAYLAQRGQKE